MGFVPAAAGFGRMFMSTMRPRGEKTLNTGVGELQGG